MFKFSAVFSLFIQLAMSIVVRNSQYIQSESTTLPTELYKPLQTVTEQSVRDFHGTPNVPQQIFKQENGNAPANFEELGNFKKYFVSKTYTLDSDISDSATNQQKRPFYTIRFESLKNPFPILTQRLSNPNDEEFSLPHHSITDNYHNFPMSGENLGTGHFQMSSSNSYFNSDTMSQPVVHHYEFDTRNGGSFQ